MKSCLVCDSEPVSRAALALLLSHHLPLDVEPQPLVDASCLPCTTANAVAVINLHAGEAQPGLACCRGLVDQGQQCNVLVLVPEPLCDDALFQVTAFESGADGVLCCSSLDVAELVQALQTLLSGESLWCMQKLRRLMQSPIASEQATWAERLTRLTPREREVFDILVTGASYKIIAAQLTCGTRTVQSHVCTILRKLEVDSTKELLARSVGSDLIS